MPGLAAQLNALVFLLTDLAFNVQPAGQAFDATTAVAGATTGAGAGAAATAGALILTMVLCVVPAQGSRLVTR